MCKILGIKYLWTTPYHPQTNGLVERSHQMIIHIIRKLGEDKKADWPSHLAEIMHTYNATCSAVTGYSQHYLMFQCRPRLPVDFFFPTIGSSEAPMREASAKHVDKYIASIQDRLRTALWEVQAQSMVEACWQKWYCDRKKGAVNLKPGDLVLVKADAFKGKRKIKDRWEEDTWEVVHQITIDVPPYEVMNQNSQSRVLHQNQLLVPPYEVMNQNSQSWVLHQNQLLVPPYEVMNQNSQSWVLHQNQLLLIASEIGISLCIGIHQAWDSCTSPTPHKTTSTRGEMKITPQENNGKVVTHQPTRKASLGWINRKLWLLLWTSTGVPTEDGWRP